MGTKGLLKGRVVSYYDPAINPEAVTGLWSDCPLQEWLHDPTIGVMYEENWIGYDATNDWVLTQATAGSAAASTTVSGTLSINSGSTTATQGATLQRDTNPWFLAANADMWAEFRVSFTGVAALNVETFIGLSEVDTTLIATSANSSANHVGWQSVTDDGVLLFTAEKAGAGTTKAATTIVSGTAIRLGFKVTGVTSIAQYIDGVHQTATDIATDNVPVVKVVPSFICQSGGTDQPILHAHGFRIFQLYP